MKRYTLSEVLSMPVIDQGHSDDLIVYEVSPRLRVWRSRLTVEDGMPYDNQITVERFENYVWVAVDTYRPV